MRFKTKTCSSPSFPGRCRSLLEFTYKTTIRINQAKHQQIKWQRMSGNNEFMNAVSQMSGSPTLTFLRTFFFFLFFSEVLSFFIHSSSCSHSDNISSTTSSSDSLSFSKSKSCRIMLCGLMCDEKMRLLGLDDFTECTGCDWCNGRRSRNELAMILDLSVMVVNGGTPINLCNEAGLRFCSCRRSRSSMLDSPWIRNGDPLPETICEELADEELEIGDNRFGRNDLRFRFATVRLRMMLRCRL